jgi:S1-C subfamily serine protease
LLKFRERFKIVARKIAREERQMANKVNGRVVKKGVKKVVSKVIDNAVIGVLVLALVLASAAGAYAFYLGEKLAASQKQQAAEISALRDEMGQSSINASKLYQQASPSIVRISNGEVTGSGFVFDAAGHILTNEHVIEGDKPIYIITADGRALAATIIGSDKYSDIAVLRPTLYMPALNPPALTLVDSNTVKAGDPVIVIGNPPNLPWSLTSGIISHTGRTVEIQYTSGSRAVANIIQFDAAINFGDSGGPLLNAKGEVIGMVVARIDPQQGDGVYYAVSSNKLKRVASSLIERGSFDYPWLGVELTDLTPLTVATRNLATINGVLVKMVLPAEPAATAGVRADDIITAINGTEVKDTADLTCYLGEYTSYGDEVTLALIRDGRPIELTLTAGKRVD